MVAEMLVMAKDEKERVFQRWRLSGWRCVTGHFHTFHWTAMRCARRALKRDAVKYVKHNDAWLDERPQENAKAREFFGL
jgi:hypothetical protein